MDKRYRQLLSTVSFWKRTCSRRGENLHNLQDDLATTQQQFRDAVTALFPMDVNAPASVIVPVSVTPSNPAECILPSCSSRIPNPKRRRLESDTCDATPVKVQF